MQIKKNKLIQLAYELEVLSSKISNIQKTLDEINDLPDVEALFNTEMDKKLKRSKYNRNYYQKKKKGGSE